MTDHHERLRVEKFLRDRDEASFLELYRTFTPRLYSLASHLLGGNCLEAEEVVQDLWIRAVRRLPEFRWESGLRTWLTGILIRCCSEKRRISMRRTIPVETTLSNLDDGHNQELTVQLQIAIARLPDRQKEVFLLHDVEGYTHEEIASLLQIETGSSKSQLSHARRSLRSSLENVLR